MEVLISSETAGTSSLALCSMPLGAAVSSQGNYNRLAADKAAMAACGLGPPRWPPECPRFRALRFLFRPETPSGRLHFSASTPV